MLAVGLDYQCKGYGSRLVHSLKGILSTLAPHTLGCIKLMHVQADNGAVDFWSKQGFVASSEANEVTTTLAFWHPSGNELFYGITSMMAKV